MLSTVNAINFFWVYCRNSQSGMRHVKYLHWRTGPRGNYKFLWVLTNSCLRNAYGGVTEESLGGPDIKLLNGDTIIVKLKYSFLSIAEKLTLRIFSSIVLLADW
ncbi:uncharacterized protein LOC143471238 [Clavelina lepadiformis]|uniref:uncharacterized protein LOC143471238 n=1 Tax=Clavelina lepadiformis TaxID=159417 RepID=UPI00404386C8